MKLSVFHPFSLSFFFLFSFFLSFFLSSFLSFFRSFFIFSTNHTCLSFSFYRYTFVLQGGYRTRTFENVFTWPFIQNAPHQRDSSTRFSTSAFFHLSNTPKPLIHILKYFRIRLRIRRDFQIRSLLDRSII